MDTPPKAVGTHTMAKKAKCNRSTRLSHLHKQFYTSYQTPNPNTSQGSPSERTAAKTAPPLTYNPTTPPNALFSFEEPGTTPSKIPPAREVCKDLYMADSKVHNITEAETEYADLPEHEKVQTRAVETMHKKIKQRERIVRNTPSTPTGYNNDPALVEKVTTLTTNVAKLERISLLRIIQPATPHPPSPTAPTAKPSPRAKARFPPGLAHPLPAPPASPPRTQYQPTTTTTTVVFGRKRP